jgi:hypothetical protein
LPRRSTGLALTGLVLVGLAVAFFVVTSIRDAAFLRSGERVDAVVVKEIPPSGWNFFDYGRTEVRYVVDGQTYTSTIWLDDTNTRPPGARWTVVVDRGDATRVRSLSDANDPVPLGFFVAIGGLVGLLLGVAGLVWRISQSRLGRRWSGCFNKPDDRSGLSPKEQLQGLVLTLAVDSALALCASALGWSWAFRFGRLLLVPPTLLTFGAWRQHCLRSNRRDKRRPATPLN